LILPLIELDGNIRAEQFTKSTVLAPFRMGPKGFVLVVQDQDFFGTKGDANPTTLAPFYIDVYVPLLTHWVRSLSKK
jgi:hypothetical protein